MSRIDFCKIKNSAETGHVEIYFYGDIVSDSWEAWQWEDQYPENVRAMLRNVGDRDVDIHINSGGGDVFAGNTICNLLRQQKGKKTVYIDGIAASIASVIAMAGDEIVMPENATMMIHKPSISSFGSDAPELRSMADLLDQLEDGMIATYMTQAREGVTEDGIRQKLAAETWLDAGQAAELFANVRPVEAVKAAAHVDSKYFSGYQHLPDGIRNSGKESAQTPVEDDIPFIDMEFYDAYLDQVAAAYSDREDDDE